ncbi:MAG: triose-phosphate isomerase [Elusimicrobia bacterium]|nr:triose-phosphate isomerase [Elusimicrobiota bacterium]
MKRQPLIVANWKMHKQLKEALEFVRELRRLGADQLRDRTVVLCAPATALLALSEVLKDSAIRLGAQNAHWEQAGAFTGEISPTQLLDVGCSYVILGHSERREHFAETDDRVRQKLRAALCAGLHPIVCVGERGEEREAQRTHRVLERQIGVGLGDLAPTELGKMAVAYEPVWAIGTGVTARPDQAQQAQQFIRSCVAKAYGPEAAQALRILYGGSVQPDHMDSLLAQPDVDGALVGGASLSAQDFWRIISFHSQLTPTHGSV